MVRITTHLWPHATAYAPQEVDVMQLASTLPPIPEACPHEDCDGKCWKEYPASRFPNWTPSQVKRSRIQKVIDDPFERECKIYAADVDTKGYFSNVGEPRTVHNTEASANEFWRDIVHEKTLISTRPPSTRAPPPGAGCYLVLDLLSVHLIRNVEGNTIISYHHSGPDATSAQYLHERIRFAGQSVYWQSIFQKSPDPTFVLLTFIWHAMYAWDEALETLYNHICWLETTVLQTSNMQITRSLHIIRAHHLHYYSLLEDFRKAVLFVRHTPNPAMDSQSEELRNFSKKLLEKECDTLLSEIGRLEMGRNMQDKRLKNVMNLVFSTVNIGDSRRMQDLTEAAVRDSAAMKQIAYLSMVFLPASFVAAVFGMNVHEIAPDTKQTLPHYFLVAMPLTVATIWLVMTIQSKYILSHRQTTFMQRLAWPYLLARELFWGNRQDEKSDIQDNIPTSVSPRDSDIKMQDMGHRSSL
ncbi:hypothetical protein AAF712_003927 [Marasmius tenuissimus]|uniref:Uncharacterized protein n=1 Tax=Marasmius tenuissimus TaxID=585030 RepID=A0ABR3A7H6_9AGAR